MTPPPTHYTVCEGGSWLPWPPFRMSNGTAKLHAIRFADNTVLDVVNGWRTNTMSSRTIILCDACGQPATETDRNCSFALIKGDTRVASEMGDFCDACQTAASIAISDWKTARLAWGRNQRNISGAIGR